MSFACWKDLTPHELIFFPQEQKQLRPQKYESCHNTEKSSFAWRNCAEFGWKQVGVRDAAAGAPSLEKNPSQIQKTCFQHVWTFSLLWAGLHAPFDTSSVSYGPLQLLCSDLIQTESTYVHIAFNSRSVALEFRSVQTYLLRSLCNMVSGKAIRTRVWPVGLKLGSK